MNSSLMLALYRQLKRIRTLEGHIFYLYQNQNLKKPLLVGKGYLSTGQEAISVGASMALEENDWVAPSHRDLGVHLVRGVSPREIFAQYFCRETGPTRGRDGNVHFGYSSKKILGFISHMGASLPVANGLAWALRYRNEKQAVLAFFGDGASSQGCVHEAMNYAAVFQLPIVFICNNNGWAISTPVQQQTLIENVSDRAAAYGFEGMTLDGNEVLQIYEATYKALQKARDGKGPTLIECKTFRMGGHGTYDPANYVPLAQKEYWSQRDPIFLLRQKLEIQNLWGASQEAALQAEIDVEIQEAVTWAAEQPLPDPKKLLEGVYADLNLR